MPRANETDLCRSLNTINLLIISLVKITTQLLEKYIDELDIDLNKDRLKSIMRGLYNEAQDLEL